VLAKYMDLTPKARKEGGRMHDFAAIDFETANEKRSSVCSMGVVIVRGGQIVESLYRLIRPAPNYYTYFTTSVHGMTYADTMNAAAFPEVWVEIAPKLAGLPLVAHNSAFDKSCLRSVHEYYGMAYPEYTFHCTYRASRKVFGAELPNHQLQTVAKRCGYHLDQHHHALADAEACAWIARQIL
jgi:DNA polymerase-3 subunit epsilon